MQATTVKSAVRARSPGSRPMRAVVYLRVASAGQGPGSDLAARGQREACYEQCAKISATPVAEYIDMGSSARSERPGLTALRDRLERGDIDYVVVSRLDRLARQPTDCAVIAETINQAGTRLVSAAEGMPDTPAALFMHDMMATVAKLASASLAEATKRGMAAKAERGERPGVRPSDT